MAKEIIGFINKNNDIFNLKDDSSASKYCCKVGQGHENKIASFTEDGDLKDSEYRVEDFAQAEHSHSQLILPTAVDPTESSHISLEEIEHQGRIHIRLYNTETEESDFLDYVTADMLNNTFHPATAPAQGNQELITSGAVYTALQGKANSVHTHSGIEKVIENEQYAKVYADNHNQGEPSVIIELNNSNTPWSPVAKSANINIDSIDNLNRALDKPDAAPNSGSDNLVTSGGVYTALSSKANSSHTHTVNNVNNLLSTIISLTERIRALEVPVSETITLHGDYPGYNALLNSSNEDIMTAGGVTNRARLVNLENLTELAQIGSKVTLYYEYNNLPLNFTTVVVDKGITYSKNYILLNDEIPNLSFHSSAYSNIRLTITK